MARTRTWMHYNTGADGAAAQDATLGVHGEYLYSAAVALTDDSTTVYTGECVLAGIYVNATISNHSTVIKDGTTTVLTLPNSATIGSMYNFPGIRFNTSIVCDPDNATTTGSLVFIYRPL